MLTKLKENLIDRIASWLEAHNSIRLSADSAIHKTVRMKGARIQGQVSIAEGARIINGVRINAESKVSIGRYTALNGPNMDIVSKINPVVIGAFCSIARNVTVQEFNHKIDALSTYHMHQNVFQEDRAHDIYSNGAITIGNDVWIGTHCVILSGAKIGNGAIVSANSVVTGEVPPYAIVGGSPAKVLKYRFDEKTIQALEELKWWNWDLATLKENKPLFQGTFDFDRLVRK